MGDPVIASIIAATAAVVTLVVTAWNNRRIEEIREKVGRTLLEIKAYDEAQQKAAEQRRGEIYASDRELRNLRISAYSALWKMLGQIHRNLQPLPEALVLKEISDAIANWYYEVGGLVLTAETRDVVLDVRDVLKSIAEGGGAPSGNIDQDAYDKIFEVTSSLRTCLTSDTYSRTNAQLSDSQRKDREEAERNLLVAMNHLGLTPKTPRLRALMEPSPAGSLPTG